MQKRTFTAHRTKNTYELHGEPSLWYYNDTNYSCYEFRKEDDKWLVSYIRIPMEGDAFTETVDNSGYGLLIAPTMGVAVQWAEDRMNGRAYTPY